MLRYQDDDGGSDDMSLHAHLLTQKMSSELLRPLPICYVV